MQKLDFSRQAAQFGKKSRRHRGPQAGGCGLYNRLSVVRWRTVEMSKFVLCVMIVIALLLSAPFTAAQDAANSPELVVAAAADLSAALKEVADGYEKQTGVKVKLSFGASGALTQQIQNGAPFDIFFSADMDYPRQLISAGDADGASLYQYAVGKLVLWVPADSARDEHKGMNILLDPAVKKIAIANPQHAPYGRAAVAALKHAGLYERLSDRLVPRGECVAGGAVRGVRECAGRVRGAGARHCSSDAGQGQVLGGSGGVLSGSGAGGSGAGALAA
jgi:molybdenum ABC transporter molybdate-binding protein